MNKSIRKVRSALARSRHTAWWVGTKVAKDMERLATITSMIDKWSMAYTILVGVVGVVQVMVLRRLFNSKPGTTHLNVRI